MSCGVIGKIQLKATHPYMVGLSRIELLTSRLSGVRSNHLSYRPIMLILRRQKFD